MLSKLSSDSYLSKKDRKLKTMTKSNLKQWLLAGSLAISGQVFSQNCSVQLCAFIEEIEPAFFHFAGFENVAYHTNPFSFHCYTWGQFTSTEEAVHSVNAMQGQPVLDDLTNLTIISNAISPFVLPMAYSPDKIHVKPADQQLFKRTIPFTVSNAFQSNDIQTLEEVVDILTENPSLKLRILGTKAAGEEKGITTATTNSIEKFFLAMGIPAFRLKTIERKESNADQEIILTLVDLKEEIVLDNFGKDHIMVKESVKEVINLLE